MKGSFGVRKGAWTEEEDILLKQCIQKHGEGKWHMVPVSAGIILESRVSEIDFSFFLGKPSSFCLCLLCLFFQFVRNFCYNFNVLYCGCICKNDRNSNSQYAMKGVDNRPVYSLPELRTVEKHVFRSGSNTGHTGLFRLYRTKYHASAEKIIPDRNITFRSKRKKNFQIQYLSPLSAIYQLIVSHYTATPTRKSPPRCRNPTLPIFFSSHFFFFFV